MPEDRYLLLLAKAESSTHGIKIQSDDTAELRKRLHAKAQKHAWSQRLSLRISPTDPDTLWIVKEPDETQAQAVPSPE